MNGWRSIHNTTEQSWLFCGISLEGYPLSACPGHLAIMSGEAGGCTLGQPPVGIARFICIRMLLPTTYGMPSRVMPAAVPTVQALGGGLIGHSSKGRR